MGVFLNPPSDGQRFAIYDPVLKISQDSASQEAFHTFASVLGSNSQMADKFIAHSLLKSYKMLTIKSIQAHAQSKDILVKAPEQFEKTDL